MNPFITALTTIFGPTNVGGFVRAAVASGLTLAASKYMPGVDTSSYIPDIAALASTVVVGLWSSLGKTGKIYVPDVVKTIETQAQIGN